MNPLAWLYAQWMATPVQVREPLKSAFVSSMFIANGLIVYMMGESFISGAWESSATFFDWAHRHALHAIGAFLYAAAVSSGYRIAQAQTRLAHTAILDNGAEVIVTPPKPLAKIWTPTSTKGNP